MFIDFNGHVANVYEHAMLNVLKDSYFQVRSFNTDFPA